MTLKWGILGCGDVAEYKGGPPLYSVEGSELVAVMRRDAIKAESFAERHGAKRAYTNIEDLLAIRKSTQFISPLRPICTANRQFRWQKRGNTSCVKSRWRSIPMNAGKWLIFACKIR